MDYGIPSSPSLNFRQDPHRILQSMPLTESGHLVRFIIAAKFNHSVPSGWPTLQIKRRVNNGSHEAVATTTMEPRPTGYLNVFEYKMSAEIQPGDIVHVDIPEQDTESSRQRYLLAYVGETSKPMVSIEVSNHSQSITTLSMVLTDVDHKTPGGDHGTTAAADAAKLITTTEFTATTKLLSSHKEQPVVVIVGGILCILVVLILLTGVSTTLFVIYRCKNKSKDSSPGISDVYTAVLPSSSVPILHNPTYSSLAIGKFHTMMINPQVSIFEQYAGSLPANTRSETSENVYLSDDVLPCSDQRTNAGDQQDVSLHASRWLEMMSIMRSIA